MPVYEYECTACGHPVEVMHSYTAPGPQVCERCGAPMRKLLSTPAIVFKGSGWAKKDHRDKVHASSTAAAAKTTADAAAATAAATGDTGTPAPAPDASAPASPAPAATPAASTPATPVPVASSPKTTSTGAG